MYSYTVNDACIHLFASNRPNVWYIQPAWPIVWHAAGWEVQHFVSSAFSHCSFTNFVMKFPQNMVDCANKNGAELYLCQWNVQEKFHVVLSMTLNCIHIFIVTGSFLYWCAMRPSSQRFFIHSCIYLRIWIISYLATFLIGTNSLSVLMCRKAVNQSIILVWTIVLLIQRLDTVDLM